MTESGRTSMEGMIQNANRVLDMALSPSTPGIPRSLLQRCKGVVLLSVLEAGFLFAGNVGTGIVLAQQDDGSWSAPSAVGLSGIGFGVLAGAAVKDIIVVVMDDPTMDAMSGNQQIKVGGQAGATVGPVGRQIELSFHLSEGGAGGSFSYCFSRGLFGGFSLESAILGARNAENSRFYGKDVTLRQILYEEGVDIPSGKGIQELHDKLDLMKQGEVLYEEGQTK